MEEAEISGSSSGAAGVKRKSPELDEMDGATGTAAEDLIDPEQLTQRVDKRKQEDEETMVQYICSFYDSLGMKCDTSDAEAISNLLARVGVAEVYSPPRLTAMAATFGLTPGIAVDLTTPRN